ncbi:amidohydrolase family protein [Microbacterium kunmingense]|uniref:amidohydrolase family protein n=1 Tax=Microbacterium kunmingense TaxID=2915939 RepID=UPI003D72C879
MPHPDALPALPALPALLGPDAAPVRRALTDEEGISLPAFVDHHVHLHLIDGERLPLGGIAAVVDLGGDPAVLAARPAGALPHVTYAGAFLTTLGGYPAGREWAPPAIVRQITDPSPQVGRPGGAATAVDEQRLAGASVIKIVLHHERPLPDDAMTTIVETAHAAGLVVVAHVEGDGMTRRALDAGVDALAHTPFSERLDDDLIARAAAAQVWISTLDIHRDDADAAGLARENLRAFRAAGGRVVYGTDLGNGELPLGVNPRELRALISAGCDGPALVAALTDPWPGTASLPEVRTFLRGRPPGGADDLDALADWLASASVVPTEDLIPAVDDEADGADRKDDDD